MLNLMNKGHSYNVLNARKNALLLVQVAASTITAATTNN